MQTVKDKNTASSLLLVAVCLKGQCHDIFFPVDFIKQLNHPSTRSPDLRVMIFCQFFYTFFQSTLLWRVSTSHDKGKKKHQNNFCLKITCWIVTHTKCLVFSDFLWRYKINQQLKFLAFSHRYQTHRKKLPTSSPTQETNLSPALLTPVVRNIYPQCHCHPWGIFIFHWC